VIFLHRGDRFIAIDKPPGVAVIPGRGEATTPSIREQLEAELKRKIYVVHRLDRDTSGVLLFALDAETHRALSMAFEANEIQKRYLALVEGRLELPVEISAALVPARRGRMRVARPSELGKAALTSVRPVELLRAATLVEAAPKTGRTHQIRVHLAHAGHPLLFDHQYGKTESTLIKRTPLHAASLELPARIKLTPAKIDSPMPADMAEALIALR
jgi:RluA family pseudouridine synthase